MSNVNSGADLPELLAQLVDILNTPHGEIALLDIAINAEAWLDEYGPDGVPSEDVEDYTDTYYDLVELLKEIAHVP